MKRKLAASDSDNAGNKCVYTVAGKCGRVYFR